MPFWVKMVMRKLVLEIEPNEMIRDVQGPIFEKVRSYTVLEMLKMDWDEAIKIDLVEFVTQEGVSIQETSTIGPMEVLSVLRSEGSKHICLVKYVEPDATKEFTREFDLDVIWTTPMTFSRDRRTFSCIGEQEAILKVVELMKRVGRIENVTMTKAVYERHDLLSVLTDKQRKLVIAAQRHGYYDYPKRISSEKLASMFDINRGTLVEHLRKAEQRIMENLVAGYESE